MSRLSTGCALANLGAAMGFLALGGWFRVGGMLHLLAAVAWAMAAQQQRSGGGS